MRLADSGAIRRDIAELLKPPKRLRVSEAVRRYVRIKGPSGNWEPWDPETTPYMIEPLDLLTSRRYRALIFVGPARTGKTQALVDAFAGYDVRCDPSDLLIVQMSKDKAAEFGKKRYGPMLENSPELVNCISPRLHDNNIHDRIFRAGNYHKLGWPAKTVLASSDYRRVLFTDYDRPVALRDVGGEGEGFSLGLKRTQTFGTRGMCMAESSPGYEITDPDYKEDLSQPHVAPPTIGILSLYNLGDRRLLYWPCPDCGEFFPAQFRYLRWDESETDPAKAARTVRCMCPNCGTADIHPKFKRDMVASAVWVPEGCSVSSSGAITGTPRDTDIASFWMEGAAAAFQSWQQLVQNYVAAEQDYEKTGSQEKLKAVVNTDIGRAYQHRREGAQRTSERLADRKESTPKRLVPDGCRFLVACVDVQGGKHRRFVVQVHGFGVDLERWVIDRYNIKRSAREDGDGGLLPIDPAGHPEDWDQLTRYLLEKGYKLSGDPDREMRIKLVVCDHGGEAGVSANAYDYYRRLKRQGMHRKLMLVKGGEKRPELVTESWPDTEKRRDRRSGSRGDVPLYLLSSNLLKDRVWTQLERETIGPNYWHFPSWLGEWFFDELTYEERSPDGKWNKPGKGANEAWDLVCYAEAGAIHLKAPNIRWDSPPSWAEPWSDNEMIFSGDDPSPVIQAAPPMVVRRTRYRMG